jgi:hypothetical protein
MMSKRALLVALAGLNLILLTALIVLAYPPPAAMAQVGGRAGDYLMTTCQIHSDYDALAIINNQVGAMFVFVPRETAAGPKLVPTAMRNLNRDFGRR